MIGPRGTIALSLLYALLFSAIAVQNASAAAATNTTAFTCVQTTEFTSAFEDAHCDRKSPTKTGLYEHKELGSELGKTTEIQVSNETTGGTSSQTLKGAPFSVKTHIVCAVASGTGSVGNTEPEAKKHKISGTGSIKYTKCEVLEPKTCTVKEPIVATIGSVEGVEGLTGPNFEANAMGIEYKAPAGKPFTEITFEGEKCALKGKPFPVEGSVIGTSGPVPLEPQTNKSSGATSIFYMSNLTAGGKSAEYLGNTTTRMLAGNPISLTTVT